MSTNEGHEQDIGIETNGITVHPKYDPSKTGYDNDIAIIKLKRSVQYTQRIKPVCINTGIDFTGKHIVMQISKSASRIGGGKIQFSASLES